MSSSPSILFENVTYRYPFQERPALKDVSFQLNEGEMALLIGPTGCGKSTLCLMLNSTIPHFLGGTLQGKVIVNGKDISKTPVSEMAKDVAVVFQNPDEQLTCLYVDDEVAFGPENLKLPMDSINERVDSSLKFTGLIEMQKKVIYDLSGGQKQRLAIAAVLAMKPRVLVLDSPISNLDPLGGSEILRVIDDIRREGKFTSLIVEHKIDELVGMVDRIIVLSRDGTIVMNSDPRDVMANALRLRDELGLWIPQMAEIALTLRKTGFGSSSDKVPLAVEEAADLFSKYAIKVPEEKKAAPGKIENANPIIDVDDVTYTYPDGTTAVRNVSFTVSPGEFVTLLGQNGSGKTTMAYNLVGLLKPVKGRILINGKNTKTTPMAQLTKDITYVFQYPEHQFLEDKVYKEVEFELRKRKISESEIAAETDSVLKGIGLLSYKDRHPYNLSLGEKRLLSASIMTLCNPRIIILDEPTYGQDKEHNYRLMNFMRELNKKGTTIVMITHDMRLVGEYANRVVVMNQGVLVCDAPPTTFFKDLELTKSVQLEPPPVARLSMKMFGYPILTTEDFCRAV
jgi:energy-coupling factor transporter ATP-binding protein EcfA2